MTTVSRLVVVFVLFGAGFGAGIIWGQRQVGPETIAGTASSARSSPPTVPPTRAIQVQDSAEELIAGSDYATGPLSPVTSLAATAAISSEFDQSAALYSLAAPLDTQGIERLVEEARVELRGGDYLGATGILIGRYAELDFRAALDYALVNGGSARANWIQAIFHARARLDVDEAVQRATELSGELRRGAGLAIIRSNDNLSMRNRRDIAAQLGLPHQMLALTQHDPTAAWNEARDISDPMQRGQAQLQVVMKWGQSDPWAALEATGEIESEQMRMIAQGTLLGQAAAEDVEAAMNWLDNQPKSELTDQLMTTVVTQLASNNPEALERLLDRLPPRLRSQAELASWTQLAASDPEGAAAWVSRQGGASASFDAALQLVMMLGMTSQQAAERFVDALPAAERAGVESTYISVLARTNPGQAARRVELIADDQLRGMAASALVGNWGASDPVAATRWIERQPANQAPTLYSSLALNWGQRDRQAAKLYAEGMFRGANRDHFLSGLLSTGRIAPEEATEMIELIGDPVLRDQLRKAQDQRQDQRQGKAQ